MHAEQIPKVGSTYRSGPIFTSMTNSALVRAYSSHVLPCTILYITCGGYRREQRLPFLAHMHASKKEVIFLHKQSGLLPQTTLNFLGHYETW